ncbi:hypothetical protein ABLV91_12045 [Staphylococcus equorum]|nr:hypothetical protein [Staphylococcus equorum]MEB7672400.1 hypothetical protein [Staphylococcus equorum]MEB7689072.1 hypothetical protein [Staphylococcus equorum]MEB7717395.1 hypothetical protein [Staphylococcus equorum]MEB7759117.1 hypothetical protein [Staphylococcus equorum]MEB7761700.1 hypothetical protein [Staphylococcus equorum]
MEFGFLFVALGILLMIVTVVKYLYHRFVQHKQ